MLSIVRAKVTQKFAQLVDLGSLWPDDMLAILYTNVRWNWYRYAPQVLPTRRPILPSSHPQKRSYAVDSMQCWKVRLLSEASNNLVPPRLAGKPTLSTCWKFKVCSALISQTWRRFNLTPEPPAIFTLEFWAGAKPHRAFGMQYCNTGTGKE